MKKIFKIISPLLLFCFLLTGCGNGNSKNKLVSELMYGVKQGMSMKDVADILDNKGVEVQYDSISDADILNVEDTVLDYCENYAVSFMRYTFVDNALQNMYVIVSKKDATKIIESITNIFGKSTKNGYGTDVWNCDGYKIIVGGDSSGYVVQVATVDDSDDSALNNLSDSIANSEEDDINTNVLKLRKEYGNTQTSQLYFDSNGDTVTSVMQINYYYSSLWSDKENEQFDDFTEKVHSVCDSIDGVDYYIDKGSEINTETYIFDTKNYLSDIIDFCLLPSDINTDNITYLSLTDVKQELLDNGWEIIE